MGALLTGILEPGFFASEPVPTAIGGGAAVVSAVVGVFTVIREQSFAGHALAEISGAGGSASFLLGINPLLGFLIVAVAAASGLDVMDVQRARERDVMTGAAITVLFGSMFSISASVIPSALAIGAAILITGAVFRPLLLSSLDADLARVRGVPVRLIGYLHLMVLALAVSLSAMTVGAVLSTALLIGPAATAVRLTSRPGRAILLAVLIGLATTWGGIVLAYDSYYWTPGHGWPVSFFVVALIFALYLLASLTPPGRVLGRGVRAFAAVGATRP